MDDTSLLFYFFYKNQDKLSQTQESSCAGDKTVLFTVKSFPISVTHGLGILRVWGISCVCLGMNGGVLFDRSQSKRKKYKKTI